MRDLLSIGMVCPYDWAVPGGVKSHVAGLSERLRELGHQVSIFAPTTDDLSTEVFSAGDSVPVPFNGSISRVKFDPVAFRRSQLWLREHDFDVLHLHEPLSLSISPIVAWTATGPIVATQHAAYEYSVAVKSGRFLANSVLERCTVRVAVSELARRSVLESVGGDALIIPNGIDVEFFKTAKPVRVFESEVFQVLFIGRLEDERKGLAELLIGLQSARASGIDIKLAIVGMGDLPEEYENLNSDTKDAIKVVGPVSDVAKAELLRGTDLFIAPNLSGESFGIILTEAMSAGAPIAASNIEAFRLVLADGRAGRLFDPTIDGIAAALIAAYENQAEGRAKAEYASKLVWRYDWDVVTERILDCYDSARLAGERVREDLAHLFIGRWGRRLQRVQ
jgi:phosphatidyl-myo-inositol alpha-mannosyltransferase